MTTIFATSILSKVIIGVGVVAAVIVVVFVSFLLYITSGNHYEQG